MKELRFSGMGAVAVLAVMAVGCAKPGVSGGEVRAATASPPPAAAPVAPQPRAVKPAATLFGDLFEPGRVFRYQVEQRSSFYDPEDPRADTGGYVESKETSQILCAVSDVREILLADGSRAKASRLDCGDGNSIGMSGASVAGIYVLGAKGIQRYALDTKDEDFAAIPDEQSLVLEHAPVASKKVDEGEDHTSTVEVKKDADGAWCKSQEEMYGDYFASSDCFVPGKGIVRAGREFSGGSTMITTFTAI